MRPTPPVVSLLGILLIACSGGDDGGAGADGGNGDGGAEGPDAAQICRAVAGNVDPTDRDRNDFQTSCGEGAEAADDAFTWTAPSAGFYQFTAQALTGQGLGDAPAVAVLDGTCGGDELACGCHSYTVAGEKESTAIAYVDQDQTVTVVAEECAGPAARSNLAVIERACPAVDAPTTGSTSVTMLRGEVVKLPCTTCFDGTTSCVQTTLGWTAPQSGTFQFAVAEGYAADKVAVAVLDVDCRGNVAACEASDDRATATATVTGGDVKVIVVESTFYDEEPMGYTPPMLRVTRTIENP